jgi:uncharacterized membrane protein YkoI
MTKTFRNLTRALALSFAAIATTAGGGIALAQSSDGAQARISLDDASRIALEQFPDGTVESVELDHHRGIEVYEVEVQTGRWTEHEVIIDAHTGAVIRIKNDD